MSKIRVLVVDDSHLTQKVLTRILTEDEKIEVAGVAGDAFSAEEKIRELKPDVITLDIEMPGMNGLEFLEHFKKMYSIPVVVVSTWGDKGSDKANLALSLGAFEVIKKPTSGDEINEIGKQIADAVKRSVKS